MGAPRVARVRRQPRRLASAADAATIEGTSGDDWIVGTPQIDVIAGLTGNDLFYEQDGNDIICGNEGADSLIGRVGADLLHGATRKRRAKLVDRLSSKWGVAHTESGADVWFEIEERTESLATDHPQDHQDKYNHENDPQPVRHQRSPLPYAHPRRLPVCPRHVEG